MSSEWRLIKVQDLGTIVTGRTPPSGESDYYGEETPFLTPSDFGDLRKVEITGRRLSKTGTDRMSKILVPSGVGISCIGWQMGKAVLIDQPTITNQQINSIIISAERIDKYFVYYSLSTRRNEFFTLGSGGSRTPILNKTDFGNLDFLLPPVSEQKAIAHILGTLDNKIELNRKTNETLEAMAKALFKSWFVDFDPVRAKAEGRSTGLSPEISDLFPDSFEDSELGEIPSGWSISCVNDLCDWVSSGGTPSRSRKDFWENGNIPWFKTGELNDAPLLDSAEKINELALGNSSCKYWEAGTILFAIYASPTVGRLGVLTESGTSNQAAAGLKAKGVIGTPFLRRTLLFSRDELQNIAVGAAQQNINVQILKDHKVVAPGIPLATVYSKSISPLDEQQICLAKSTRELCLLRDALLPKLISGEIRIPDAEKMLEEVVL